MTNVIQYMMRKEWKFQRLNSELFNENQRLGYPNYLKLDKFTNMIFKNLFKLNFNPKNWLLLIGTINLFWMNWRIFDDIFVLLIHIFYWYLPWIKVRKQEDFLKIFANERYKISEQMHIYRFSLWNCYY